MQAPSVTAAPCRLPLGGGFWLPLLYHKSAENTILCQKTVLESILYSVQSLTILTANSSLYSKSKLRFISVLLRTQSRQSRVWNPKLVAVWNQAAGKSYARLRVMPYAFGDSMQCASALMPCQACGLDKIKQVEPKFDLFYFGGA